MGTVYNKHGSAKDEAFMIDIVLKYHPEFRDLPTNQKTKLVSWAKKEWFNMEKLVEETISLYGLELGFSGMKQTNADGMDYVDGSDAKTCVLREYWDSSVGSYKYKGKLCHVDSKVGAIRAVIFNEYVMETQLYFIPHDNVKELRTGNNINLTTSDYSVGRIPSLDEFRVNSFEELCSMVDESEFYFDGESIVYSVPEEPMTLASFF